MLGGGQDKLAWTACPPGVKITRVGGKISWDSLPPGGQAVQGGKINCYTGIITEKTTTMRHLTTVFMQEYEKKTLSVFVEKNKFYLQLAPKS